MKVKVRAGWGEYPGPVGYLDWGIRMGDGEGPPCFDAPPAYRTENQISVSGCEGPGQPRDANVAGRPKPSATVENQPVV